MWRAAALARVDGGRYCALARVDGGRYCALARVDVLFVFSGAARHGSFNVLFLLPFSCL